MKDMMDIVKKVRSAAMSGAGNWIKQGRGVAIVGEIGIGEGFKGLKFSADLLIESSESLPDAEPTATSSGQPEAANAPGASVSFLCMLEGEKKKVDTAYKNMKTFLYKLLDESEESINAAAAARVAAGVGPGPDQVPADWAKGAAGQPWTGDNELSLILTKISSKEQPLMGMAIRYQTARVTTLAGKRITVVNWYTVEQKGPEIAARRARVLGQGQAAAPAA